MTANDKARLLGLFFWLFTALYIFVVVGIGVAYLAIFGLVFSTVPQKAGDPPPEMIMSVNKSYYPALALNSVLGGGYSSRLNLEIRIKRGLSYGAGSNFSCRQILINGDRNKISVDAFSEVVLNGYDNNVEYSKYVNGKQPVITDNSKTNTISKAAASEPAKTKAK